MSYEKREKEDINDLYKESISTDNLIPNQYSETKSSISTYGNIISHQIMIDQGQPSLHTDHDRILATDQRAIIPNYISRTEGLYAFGQVKLPAFSLWKSNFALLSCDDEFIKLTEFSISELMTMSFLTMFPEEQIPGLIELREELQESARIFRDTFGKLNSGAIQFFDADVIIISGKGKPKLSHIALSIYIPGSRIDPKDVIVACIATELPPDTINKIKRRTTLTEVKRPRGRKPITVKPWSGSVKEFTL